MSITAKMVAITRNKPTTKNNNNKNETKKTKTARLPCLINGVAKGRTLLEFVNI